MLRYFAGLLLVLSLAACGGGADTPAAGSNGNGSNGGGSQAPVASSCLDTAATSGSGTPDVSYFAGALPQMRIALQGRQVMLTLLRDDMLHVAFCGHLDQGMPYFSPMIANTDFTGPSSYTYDAAAHRLATQDIAVQADGACFVISATGADAHVLHRVCTTDAPLTVQLSKEDATQVLGLGEYLSTAHASPSWLGLQRMPASQYGNAMTYSNIGGSGDAQVPVAYVLGQGMRSHGLFFDTPYPLEMDFSGANWQIRSRASPALGMFVFVGPDLASLRHDYLQLTGTAPVPPLKAFGLWLSEYGFDNWAELDDKIKTLGANHFPQDGAVLDLQWFGGIDGTDNTRMGSLTWDTGKFPDPRGKLAAYANAGLGIVTIEESYVGKGLPEYAQLGSQRYLAMDCAAPCTNPVYLTANPWWGKGGMIDWTNPAAGSFWHDAKRRALIDDGVFGHWTDLGEPEMYSADAYYDGYDWYGKRVNRHADIHNLYNFFWSQSIAVNTARTHPERRPWILSRSGTAGSQRFGVAMWSGDVATTFATLDAQMTAQANMSLSGFDYYGSDIGGFHRNGVTGAALDTIYTRWFVTSALLDVPVRPHTENLCNCSETAPDRVGDRPSNLAALQLRYQLAPYLYSLAHDAYRNGDPVFPPLAYYFQSDVNARSVDHTKMIGPWLLFTGLTSDSATVDTYLPAGNWADFYHPERIVASAGANSAQQVMVDNLVRAPLFLREGAIVPMLRAAPASLAKPGDTNLQWFGDLVIRTYPAANETSFTLTEDDGATRAYQAGKLARTQIRAQRTAPGSFHLVITPDNRTGAAGTRRLAFDIVTPDTPQHVTVNGTALPGAITRTGNMLRIELGNVDVNAAQDIVVSP